MAKIDRLGWAAGLAFEAYGLRIGVRTNDADVAERLDSCLPPNSTRIDGPFVDYLLSLRVGKPSGDGRAKFFHLLYAGLTRVARSLVLDEVVRRVENEVDLYVGEHAKDRVFVHAGVVGWQGKAIVLPGHSFSGKSTLVSELLRAGATFYSDEFAVLDDRGYVHPYPRPVSMRTQEGQFDRDVPPAEYGAAVGTEPLPVGLVALAAYQPGARWQPRELRPARSIVELIQNSLPMMAYPQRTLAALENAVRDARHVKGVRGEAAETAAALLRHIDP